MVETGVSGWRRTGLAFAGGAAAALGQAPVGFWWATLAGLAGVIWLLQRSPDRRTAFWVGLSAGTGYFGLSLLWIVEPFLIDIARHGWMAPFALVLLAAGLGPFWGVAAWLARLTWHPSLGLVAAFVALEWLRGVMLTGFPWAQVGHVWIGTPVDQLAAVLGPSGLSLLTFGAAALPVALRFRGGVIAACLLALAFGFGSWRLAQPLPPDREGILRL
ncbi:MAG: apolipoprotein N-acyltransferase, partial [Tabrizicola sp.]|nr:apolipoprotein N-acyltransferase [Tabrizicola sp.]